MQQIGKQELKNFKDFQRKDVVLSGKFHPGRRQLKHIEQNSIS
jgi:hypothetical protein